MDLSLTQNIKTPVLEIQMLSSGSVKFPIHVKLGEHIYFDLAEKHIGSLKAKR